MLLSFNNFSVFSSKFGDIKFQILKKLFVIFLGQKNEILRNNFREKEKKKLPVLPLSGSSSCSPSSPSTTCTSVLPFTICTSVLYYLRSYDVYCSRLSCNKGCLVHCIIEIYVNPGTIPSFCLKCPKTRSFKKNVLN